MEYWKQDRKLDAPATTVINELGKILAKKIRDPGGCPIQTLIEVGITEFLFERKIEFGKYLESPPYKQEPPMSEWLILERLPHNDLPLPQYGTARSMGCDFAACLTRPCTQVESSGKKKFLVNGNSRTYFNENIPELDGDPNAVRGLEINPGETIMVPLGFKCEFGDLCVLHLHVRSSIGLNGFLLANGTGIIDPDYRGELFACMYNRTDQPQSIVHGQRIVQGILVECQRPVITEAAVSNTARGEGGFGSTGTMIQERAKDLQPQSKPATNNNASSE